MRVVQLLPDMNVGGVERGVAELSRALAGAAESIVVSRPGVLSAAIKAGGGRHVAFDCGGKNPLTAWARAKRLRFLLRVLRPDIVHVRSRVPAWLLYLARTADDRFAVVSTFHGIYGIGPYSARMADAARIICPSRAVMDYVRANYRAPPEKLRLIHRGVDLDYFAPARADEAFCRDFRRRHDIGGGRAVFLIAGRLSRLKGHELFLRAFATLPHDAGAPPPLALVVGDGGRLDKLRRLAKTLRIGDDARFVGGQDNMREMYQLADVVVSASLRPEAFGRTTAEALAMNRAVVAPAHGGALDIVQDGKNGVLFAPGDARALAAAMTRARALPRRGLRESAARFSLARMAQKTLAVYEELRAADGGGGRAV